MVRGLGGEREAAVKKEDISGIAHTLPKISHQVLTLRLPYQNPGAEFFFFFSSRRRHTRCYRDWSSDVCSSDLEHVVHRDAVLEAVRAAGVGGDVAADA